MQVVSFNMGSLGFLTNHQFSDFKDDLAGVMAGTESLEECSPEGATVRPPASFLLFPSPHNEGLPSLSSKISIFRSRPLPVTG
jgi:hypothetical protein